MSVSGSSKTRSARIAAQVSPRRTWERLGHALREKPRLQQIGIAFATAALLCIVIQGWNPPFVFHADDAISRDVVANVPFRYASPEETENARRHARWQVPHVYRLDNAPLVRLRSMLRNRLLEILAAGSYEQVDPQLWNQFFTESELKTLTPDERRYEFEMLRHAVADDRDLARFERTIRTALEPFEQRGLLTRLGHAAGDGSQEVIVVYRADAPDQRQTVQVADVLIGDGTAMRQALREALISDNVTNRVFAWLQPQLTDTLMEDLAETAKAKEAAIASLQPSFRAYEEGQTLVRADQPLSADQLALLRAEYDASLERRTLGEKLIRAVAVTSLILGLFSLAALVMARQAPAFSTDRTRFTNLALLILVSVSAVQLLRFMIPHAGRIELIPVLLFAQMIAIAYTRELAMLLTGIVAFVVVLALGQDIGELMILLGTAGCVVMQLGRMRSRNRLIVIGAAGAVAAFAMTLVVEMLTRQDLTRLLVARAAMNALWTLIAGFLMTGLLPFFERPFGVLTDMSLLELTDVSHPLLHELVRRAPATYAHSILVGTLAERAADAIGARGLLVRVGAYFHDIGKILKPGYFYENQAPGDNRHASLVPQMSTLVIIAHVKDGVDLARQHKLPRPIIDLIEQHHGTTLVQYFYGLANEQQRQEDPKGEDLAETTYRYPGPKPQTKEAGILMLADAAESACRSLSEPSPQRIESLVRHVAKQRLQDGQFDDSGLTLKELSQIEDSIIKSLIANYHGRIKYPAKEPVAAGSP